MSTIRLQQNHLGQPQSPLAVQGNLVWADSTCRSVKWVADSINGRWFISQHPETPNAKVLRGSKIYPKNARVYSIGVDPCDTLAPVSSESQLSKVGIAVKRNYDKSVEDLSKVEFYEIDGIEKVRNPWDMITNRFVCTYHYRQQDPYDIYQDTLKTAVYYGAPALIESNSPYVYNRMRADFPEYVANKPSDVQTDAQRKRAKRNPFGFSAMRTAVSDKKVYNDVLISYVSEFLDDDRTFKPIRRYESVHGKQPYRRGLSDSGSVGRNTGHEF